MARIICMFDSPTLGRSVDQALNHSHHVSYLPASQLDDSVRDQIVELQPDLILLELTPRMDNPHLFFFLRAEASTRAVPIVMVSSHPALASYADMLGADGSLIAPLAAADIHETIAAFIAPLQRPFPFEMPMFPVIPADRIPLPVERRSVVAVTA